jgi:alpha-ketoglutarate-dependent 2,4-dichlorophenoxyacetate dioxygenase
MAIEIRQLHPHLPFAGEVGGVDCCVPLDTDALRTIVDAINRYAVLVFHGQRLTDDRQVAFARQFGETETSTQVHRGDEKLRLRPEMADVSNLDADHKPFARDNRRRMFNLGNMLWHTDSSFKRVPGALSMLFAHQIPPSGGETEFADLRAAYEALPSDRKAQIENLVAEHALMHSRMKLGFTEFSEQERRAMPPVPQRLVRIHPGSRRKTLYLASHASHILGMPVPEGRMLLLELIEHATQRRFVHRHTWQAGDFVIWDNRCTMHRGRPYDESYPRDLRRVTTSDVASTLDQQPIPMPLPA